MSSSKFKDTPADFNQPRMFPSNIFDLLPRDHDCFVFEDIFKHIDTSEIEQQYHHLGQKAYHPRLIISILIYAYSHGVFSSREIEQRCHQDLAFMYIAKQNCPNFRVLSDFRKNQSAFFRSSFKRSVLLARELKMASLGHIALDGSKFKASSSNHKAMSYGRLKAKEAELVAELETLINKAENSDNEEDEAYQQETGYSIPEDLTFKRQRLEKIQKARQALEEREQALNPDKPIDDKKQISFADHDARIMGKKGSGYQYCYNAQISVDSDKGIIVGQHISQHANDKQEVKPALEAIAKATDNAPIGKMSEDNGYYSGTNLQAFEDAGIDAYMATDRHEKPSTEPLEDTDRKFVKADFIYNEEDDSFTCPAGEQLIHNPASKAKTKNYRASKDVCRDCPYRSRCSGTNKDPGKVIRTDCHEAIRQAMNHKMTTKEAKAVYKRRKVIAEPPFGQIKNTGFRGFSVRGKTKVAGEFSLVCSAYNFKKIARSIATGAVRLEEAKRLKMAA
ncbi:MAG: IS1182 family transposase [Candidatus Thiodiazotropha sp. 6PLUC6]